MLFDVLPDEAFRPLTGKYKVAYSAMLQRLNDGLFSVEATDQPTKPSLVHELSDCLDALRAGMHQHEADAFRLTGADAYAELLECGWISEQREGWTVYVEMDERTSRLLATLCGLHEEPDRTFSGTMVSVLANLETAVADPALNGMAVVSAAREARDFARYVRGVVGSLKGIEKALLTQASLNGLVRAFFEEFVDRIVIGDYRNLTLSRNHPYSVKWRIVSLVDDISGDPDLFSAIAASMVQHGGQDASGAAATLQKNLLAIGSALDSIESFRLRIDTAKAGVERRFANTLRYMDLLESGRGERFSAALSAFGRNAPPGLPGRSAIGIHTGLLPLMVHYDLARASRPQAPRRPLEIQRFHQTRPDPLRTAFDRAKADFDRQISITPQRFMAYVAAKLSAGGSVEARDIPPADIEEMVIFSSLLAAPLPVIRIASEVNLRRVPGRRISNKWIECDDFVLERTMPAKMPATGTAPGKPVRMAARKTASSAEDLPSPAAGPASRSKKAAWGGGRAR